MQQRFQGANEKNARNSRGPFLQHPQLEALRQEGADKLDMGGRSTSDLTDPSLKIVDRLRAELFQGELPGLHVVCPRCSYAMEVHYCSQCGQAMAKICNELTCDRCQAHGHRLPCYFCVHCGYDLQDILRDVLPWGQVEPEAGAEEMSQYSMSSPGLSDPFSSSSSDGSR